MEGAGTRMVRRRKAIPVCPKPPKVGQSSLRSAGVSWIGREPSSNPLHTPSSEGTFEPSHASDKTADSRMRARSASAVND